MRIDFVAPRFHPSRGGIETAMEGLAADLLARGHGVTVHTTHFPELALEETWHGIRIRRYKPFPHLGYYASWFRPRLDGEVVHLHAYAHATNDRIIRRERGRRPVLLSTHHGLDFPRGPLGALYHGLYNRFVGLRSLRRLHALLVPTRGEARRFEARGVPRERIRVHPNALGEDAYGPAQGPPLLSTGRPYVLYLGRLHAEKGVIDLAEAYASRRFNFDLILAGRDEGAQARVESLRDRADLRDRLRLAGELSGPEKWAALDHALFLVLPSHHEGQGIVVAEAWARGKAVLATRAGALAEVIREGVDGLLVGPYDPGALAHGLARLAADERLRSRLGAAGRERAQTEFRRARLVDELIAVYEGAMRR